MYEDEAIKNKKDIVLDLSDTEATAKICKALSSETRLEILKCLVDKSYNKNNNRYNKTEHLGGQKRE